MTTAILNRPENIEADEFDLITESGKHRAYRTIREFAEQEIVIPDGQFAGQRYRVERQPKSGLWLDLIDSNQWQQYFLTGGTQTGKTLDGIVIPVMWHLFEWRENVIVGVPSLDMKNDKWADDFLPTIEASRYREYLPRTGPGSRGGIGVQVKFRHGPWLRFIPAGGRPAAMFGKTARILAATEINSYDKAGEASKVSDPFTEMLGRLRSFGEFARSYAECTQTDEFGRIHQEVEVNGTGSRPYMPCPGCGEYVLLERENLKGWKGAETDVDAKESTHYECPRCEHHWTEDERYAAAQRAVAVHRGQTIDSDGAIHGDAPRTLKCGFRYSAPDNLLASAGIVGVDEWSAERSEDPEGAERKMCQQVWAIPAPTGVTDVSNLKWRDVAQRTRPLARGIIPEDALYVDLGIDVGKWKHDWVLVASEEGDTPHIVNYGIEATHVGEIDNVEDGMINALRRLRERFEAGFMAGGKVIKVSRVLVDCKYKPDTIYKFIRECPPHWFPSMGFGTNPQLAGRTYTPPKKRQGDVLFIGDRYHIEKLKAKRVRVVKFDADAGKMRVHEAFGMRPGIQGAATLFEGSIDDHREFAQELCAERSEEELTDKGVVTRMIQIHEKNHKLDAINLAFIAGHMAGARRATAPPPRPQTQARSNDGFRTPDGRAFMATQR